jgi:hypothetical protein
MAPMKKRIVSASRETSKRLWRCRLKRRRRKRRRHPSLQMRLEKVCKMWETVQKFVEKHHPSKAVAVRAASDESV